MLFIKLFLLFIQLEISLVFNHYLKCYKLIIPYFHAKFVYQKTRKQSAFVINLQFSLLFELIKPNFLNLLHYIQSYKRYKRLTWQAIFFHYRQLLQVKRVQKLLLRLERF